MKADSELEKVEEDIVGKKKKKDIVQIIGYS